VVDDKDVSDEKGKKNMNKAKRRGKKEQKRKHIENRKERAHTKKKTANYGRGQAPTGRPIERGGCDIKETKPINKNLKGTKQLTPPVGLTSKKAKTETQTDEVKTTSKDQPTRNLPKSIKKPIWAREKTWGTALKKLKTVPEARRTEENRKSTNGVRLGLKHNRRNKERGK